MSGGDIIHGTVASVDAIPLGSELAAAANVGDTLLTLVDVADFWAGTRLNLNGVVYPYTTVDDTAQTVLLSTPVTTAGVVSDAVQVWDNRANMPAVTTEATVIAQGDSSTGDPIMAVVAPGVIPFLPLGVRDPANAGDAENVMLEEVNGVWHVKALAGSSMAPTLTAATVQTAADGMRMFLQAQVGNEFEGLTLTSGISNESAPAELGLFWQFPAGAVPDATTPGVSVGLRGMQFSGSGTGTVTPPTIDIFTPTGSPTGAITPAPTQTQITASADVVELASSTQQLTLGTSLELTASSSPINAGMQFGKVTGVTTTSSGGVLQAHGLGVVPTSIQVTPFMAAAGVSCRITAMTASDFTIGFFTTSTGAALSGTNVGYTWLALA